MVPKRQRGKATAVEDLLERYLDIPTRLGKYGPKLDKGALIRNRRLLMQLQEQQPNLSFVKLTMRETLKNIADTKN